MDNWIFIALMIGSFVIRFLMKKSKESQVTQSVPTTRITTSAPTRKSQPSNFEGALKQFSNEIAQELKEKKVFRTAKKPTVVTFDEPETVIVKGRKRTQHNRSKNYKIKKKQKHPLIEALKSKKRMKDVVVTTEILKTKF